MPISAITERISTPFSPYLPSTLSTYASGAFFFLPYPLSLITTVSPSSAPPVFPEEISILWGKCLSRGVTLPPFRRFEKTPTMRLLPLFIILVISPSKPLRSAPISLTSTSSVWRAPLAALSGTYISPSKSSQVTKPPPFSEALRVPTKYPSFVGGASLCFFVYIMLPSLISSLMTYLKSSSSSFGTSISPISSFSVRNAVYPDPVTKDLIFSFWVFIMSP